MAVPRGYVLTVGVRPSGAGSVDFGVSKDAIKHWQTYGPAWKFRDAAMIPEAVQAPTAIFEGLNRDGLEEGVCYATVPSGRRIREGGERAGTIDGPSLPKRVFLVFAAERDWGFVVLDWEWREADSDDPGCPKDWDKDFGRRIWLAT
jgi:hypothetical protein